MLFRIASKAPQIQMSTPINVESKIGSLNIRSINQDDDLCTKVIAFLENNKFEFYRNGEGYTHRGAVDTVELLKTRWKTGNPFSAFALLDKRKVVGFMRIGFDDDPRKIQIAGMGLETYQNQGLGKQALEWILREYLPALHAKGYRLPVYETDGKTVKEWVDLNQTSVVATVHPDSTHVNHLLLNAGFKKVQEIVKEQFAGPRHDGRRYVYESNLNQWIRPFKSSSICKA